MFSGSVSSSCTTFQKDCAFKQHFRSIFWLCTTGNLAKTNSRFNWEKNFGVSVLKDREIHDGCLKEVKQYENIQITTILVSQMGHFLRLNNSWKLVKTYDNYNNLEALWGWKKNKNKIKQYIYFFLLNACLKIKYFNIKNEQLPNKKIWPAVITQVQMLMVF